VRSSATTIHVSHGIWPFCSNSTDLIQSVHLLLAQNKRGGRKILVKLLQITSTNNSRRDARTLHHPTQRDGGNRLIQLLCDRADLIEDEECLFIIQ
jgi:hypothetical protein